MARKALWRRKATMEMQYIHGSRSLMQVINVLSDHGDAIPRFSESAHRKMCSIGSGFRDLLAPPQVPSPYQRRISTKGLGCFHIARIV
ncbi:hypothetical protein ALP12_102447 [Pseudomonas savastanoi pv. phaseolicola]|uniref:Uncharacterized protein n=2 Tax=Pseudomonas savastanoi TaxID=29438 RepID=A0A3M4N5H2_PSESG|nr:hypothetical protein ALO55_102990 [Pseudomonas savastanoi pv. phaseolicola]RMM59711.1 hypothetical protein ALQ74_103064 [Pseudomonas savastanoi pv. glycinea]RMM72369.1 hypothetical protein ALQ73_102402 [Pseudomonas savastanoi pv. glycinea]RMO23765.1 hypothetical protein ALQ46_102600 [Pseudomonas savastanoi pv. phaseolicola]RMQ58976.1 hypothetical protein ALQ02_102569 [Pseudomonas savastanoi pv. phaseolicola]